MNKLKISTTFKGFITGVIMTIILMFSFYILKMPFNGFEQYFAYTIYAIGIIWSLFEFKKLNKNNIKFKDYFSTGFKTFIIVTLIMVIFTFIFYKINTQFMENGIKENNKLLLLEGNHTPVEIENNANQIKQIFMPMMIAINTFKYLFIGTLITIIVSGYLSNKNYNN